MNNQNNGEEAGRFYCMLHKCYHNNRTQAGRTCLKHGFDRESYNKRHEQEEK